MLEKCYGLNTKCCHMVQTVVTSGKIVFLLFILFLSFPSHFFFFYVLFIYLIGTVV